MKKSNSLLIVAIVGIVAAAVFAYIDFRNVSTGGLAASTTSTVNTTTSINPVYKLSGPAISRGELENLFGPGVYVSTGNENASIYGSLLFPQAGESGTNSSFLSGNVSAYWSVLYNITSPSVFVNNTYISPFVLEQLFRAANPSFVYSQMLGGALNVTNATLDGLTYSYRVSSMLNGTIYVAGYKGDYVVTLYAFGKSANLDSIVTTISNDLTQT